jgi:hypothetical protein
MPWPTLRVSVIALIHLFCLFFGCRGKVANLTWGKRTLAYARGVAIPLWVNGLLGTALFATYEHLFTAYGLKDRCALVTLNQLSFFKKNIFLECTRTTPSPPPVKWRLFGQIAWVLIR